MDRIKKRECSKAGALEQEQVKSEIIINTPSFQDYEKMIIPVVKTTGFTTFPFQGNQTILMLPALS